MQEDFEEPLVHFDDDGAASTSDVGGYIHEDVSGLLKLTHEMPSFIDDVLEKLYETDSSNEAFVIWQKAELPAKMINNALIHMFNRILKNNNFGSRKTAMGLVD